LAVTDAINGLNAVFIIAFWANGASAETVVIVAGVTVAGVELQPVKNARVRTIETRTAQQGLPFL
jgi:hypothetical protein